MEVYYGRRKNRKTKRRKNCSARIRTKISGTNEIPRLNVFRSAKHISVQIIDDVEGKTLVSCSTMDKDLKITNGGNIEAAKAVGAEIAKRAKKAKITKVVFDRGGYLYHGRVEALADAARENGLEF